MNKIDIPFGLKLIWLTQAMGLAGLIVAAMGKPLPIIFGPWMMPTIVSNFYIAFMIVAQAGIVLDLFKLKRSAWNLLVLIEAIGIVLMFANLFISPEVLARINEGTSMNLTIDIYRTAVIPALALQLYILWYVLNKRSLFTN